MKARKCAYCKKPIRSLNNGGKGILLSHETNLYFHAKCHDKCEPILCAFGEAIHGVEKALVHTLKEMKV